MSATVRGAARAVARGLVERVLVDAGIARVARTLRTGRSLVLAYHDVIPDDAPRAGDASLHLPRAEFARQLDEVARVADLVPLAALLEAPDDGRRLRVAITFDDAYVGAVTLGVAELARRGMPATICVTPGRLGDAGFWWDRLAGDDGEVRDATREHAIEALAGIDADVLAWAEASGLPIAPPNPRFRPATLAELRDALAAPGIDAASHTWSHPNLARLDPATLVEELARPLEWARKQGIAMLPVLTYPYGRWSPSVARAARAAGYRAALRVDGGTRTPGTDDGASDDAAFRWPRLNVPAGVSARGFALRVSGLL